MTSILINGSITSVLPTRDSSGATRDAGGLVAGYR